MLDTPTVHASPSMAPLGVCKPRLHAPAGRGTRLLFCALLLGGLLFSAYSVMQDMQRSGTADGLTWRPYLLLGLALLIALGFEFVNGFHDTANAVATVIYTHALPPNVAVMWSGLFNFLGVLSASGAVAFGIISLLPVELILQVGSSAGFAMVFALLIAAILWNLATWWLGLPASSSHTLIGSILGVGLVNAWMHGRDGASGVDFHQLMKVGYALLLSPLVGFGCTALLFLALRRWVKNRALYDEPQNQKPPPFWIRGLLVLTCTGVSFAHGSNDGQKGMGLIMLILVGTVPITYALNRSMPADTVLRFASVAQVSQQALLAQDPGPTLPAPAARQVLGTYLRTHQATPELSQALASLSGDIGQQIKSHASLADVPHAQVPNVRNDMYLLSETIQRLKKDPQVQLPPETRRQLDQFKREIDLATQFIPVWVKVAVAIALGLGTMVGWRRIVVTVGEKIGHTHMSYAQGASAELTAMLTIGAADLYGLPVSTTHVLSSGVAGAMLANHSGLQWATLRHLLLAWVLTLPAAIALSGGLYYLFVQVF